MELEWRPPSSWDRICPPCNVAVWVQTFQHTRTPIQVSNPGPNVDWDETNYSGNATPWTYALWDTPSMMIDTPGIS
jgi:hypothetical protein